MADEIQLNSVELATELTVAWLANQNNRIAADDVPAFLQSMHAAIENLAGGGSAALENSDADAHYSPAVSVRRSLASRDHILSMIDGKPYRTLRRHLSGHGLTPEQYRERYKLKSDYPMVAPAYSEARRDMAHKIGLGSKGRAVRSSAPKSDKAAAKAPRASRKASKAN